MFASLSASLRLNFPLARILALLVPAALLAGALGSQFLGGLHPCEMCHWQRWPHYTAVPVAAFAFIMREVRHQRLLILLAAALIFVSGAIGFYHAGVELKIFEGLTQCTSKAGAGGPSAEELLKQIMSAPMIRCDQIQFELLGISMAGWNAIISISSALLIAFLTIRSHTRPTLRMATIGEKDHGETRFG